LAEVKAQRAARSGERQRANAVTAIQAAWRGHSCRKQLNTQLLDESLAEIAPLVIAEGGKKPVDAAWVAGRYLDNPLFCQTAVTPTIQLTTRDKHLLLHIAKTHMGITI
jgi:hypothetical protein